MTSYIKTAAMITLCIFIPPIGWLFMYKYSNFDKKTNAALAAVCCVFFLYANISAGNLNIFGGDKNFEIRMTPENFREKFNASAQKLAPNLDLSIDAPLIVEKKSFRYEFTPKTSLEGKLDDNGKIFELKIFTEPETKDESFQTINVLGLLIATLNPELDAEDRGEVLRDLRMLKNVSTEEIYDWTTNRGLVTYSVHSDKGKSTFTAELK